MNEPVQELAAAALDAVAGSSIFTHYVAVQQFVSPLDTHALNPQPLPPAPPPDTFHLVRF